MNNEDFVAKLETLHHRFWLQSDAERLLALANDSLLLRASGKDQRDEQGRPMTYWGGKQVTEGEAVAWIARNDGGKVLHLSLADGWAVEVVATLPLASGTDHKESGQAKTPNASSEHQHDPRITVSGTDQREPAAATPVEVSTAPSVGTVRAQQSGFHPQPVEVAKETAQRMLDLLAEVYQQGHNAAIEAAAKVCEETMSRWRETAAPHFDAAKYLRRHIRALRKGEPK